MSLFNYIRVIRIAFLLSCLTLVSGISKPLHAQFLRLEFRVEAETVVDVARNLDMGLIPVNYGWVQVGINDDFSGIMGIRTSENINLKITFFAPEELVMNDNNRMPLRVQAAYNNTPDKTGSMAIPFQGATAQFPVSNSGLLAENMNILSNPLRTTIHFFGSVYAGQVEPGVYTGQIDVIVEYE